MKRITGATLFSGGGLAEARLTDLIDFKLAVEFDAAIAAHYRAVYGDHVHCADVCTFDFTPYTGLDYLHASPPCTTASVANANRGETQKDIDMGTAVERAIVAIAPKMFTLENVGPYMEYQAFKSICTTLAALGYRSDYRVYNSADFGVPQTRKRLILRAWRSEYGPLPEVETTHASPAEIIKAPSFGTLFSDPLKPWVGWYEAIADLLPTCPESKLAPWQIKRLPKEITDSVLVGGANRSESFLQFAKDFRKTIPGVKDPLSPVFGISATSSSDIRAILVDGENAGKNGPISRECQRPAGTLSTCSAHRAILIDCGNLRTDFGGYTVKNSDSPSFTVVATAFRRPISEPRAILIEGDAAGERAPATLPPDAVLIANEGASGGRVHRALLVNGIPSNYEGEIDARGGERPAPPLTASSEKHPMKAVSGSRVVALTPRCLARFQSVPDAYPLPTKANGDVDKSLAVKIIGNGLASAFMRALVAPMLRGLSL
jgi:DNA (cytosine-5)-methyltransferase 1